MKKKITAILLAAVLIFCTVSVCAAADAASSLLGDVDGNGEIEIPDATLVQRHLAGITALDEEAQRRGMVSGGSELDIIDATYIQRYLAMMITSFPAENEQPEQVTKVKDVITIYFTDKKKWGAVNAYIYNKATGAELAEWPGPEMTVTGTDSDGYPVLSMDVDVSRFDRVIFNSGTKQTTETPVTKASSGYYIEGRNSKKLMAQIYSYGQDAPGTIDTVTMDFPVMSEGEQRDVYIWLPDGYDAEDTSKKYSVLYMCDGQNLFGNVHNMSGCTWLCQDTVRSLMGNGGDGVIIVGINNDSLTRLGELTPDIGEFAPEFLAAIPEDEVLDPLHGDRFSDFVVNDVIPYVESHYNTNSIRGIAGSSCGGQEAFYIGLEHMDKFRYIGAFSSAFAYFSEETWNSYLSEKDFSGNVPRMYLYTGASDKDDTEQWIYPTAIKMAGWLEKNGYPTDKMVDVVDLDARHHENYWALYFPELLSWGLDL